jgi:hypothetical protein
LDTEDTNCNQVLFKAISVCFFLKVIVLCFQIFKLLHGHVSVANQNGSVGLEGIVFDAGLEHIFMVGLLVTGHSGDFLK